MFKDLYTSGSSLPAFLTVVNNLLIFEAKDANSEQLWVCDGTAAGTKMLKRINTSGDSDISPMKVFQGKAYFTADDGSNGSEFWTSDGTLFGTRKLVPDIAPNSDPLGSTTLKVYYFDNAVYVRANYTSAGLELWKLDFNPPSSIRDVKADVNVQVYPVPSFDQITVDADTKVNELSLYTMDGKLIQSKKGDVLDLSTVVQGSYTLLIKFEDGKSVSKQILKKD